MKIIGSILIPSQILFMSIYIILFLLALIPVLLGYKPFTYYIFKKFYPQVITETPLFLKIHNTMSLVWAGIFAIAYFLVQIEYSIQSNINILFSQLIPFMPQILIGIPASILIPKYYQKQPESKLRFTNLKDAFSAMPFGLNKDVAKGIDVIVQFKLSGDEKQISHLIIKNQKCSYYKYEHTKPTLTIICDSKIWLDVINGDTDGVIAFLNKDMNFEGDASIMQKFDKLFDKSARNEIILNQKQDYEYKRLNRKIKNIVVFDGGYRNKSLSKTTLMVDKFCEGAKSVGAHVEVFKLSKFNIKDCNGCYHCWTKNPGECIHNDPMILLRNKHIEADLIIYATPLYTYSVSGIMKTFMDRLLPNSQPYMISNSKSNHISHPNRYKDNTQGFVVFSAGGFPDIEKNFDGIKAIYRSWDFHNKNRELLGEFYLPASELIVQPIYQNRKSLVEKACFDAGVQVIIEGKIDYNFMASVSNPYATHEAFKHQANNFWKILDGKKAYLKEVIKL